MPEMTPLPPFVEAAIQRAFSEVHETAEPSVLNAHKAILQVMVRRELAKLFVVPVTGGNYLAVHEAYGVGKIDFV